MIARSSPLHQFGQPSRGSLHDFFALTENPRDEKMGFSHSIVPERPKASPRRFKLCLPFVQSRTDHRHRDWLVLELGLSQVVEVDD
jgi:hypothetical protein